MSDVPKECARAHTTKTFRFSSGETVFVFIPSIFNITIVILKISFFCIYYPGRCFVGVYIIFWRNLPGGCIHYSGRCFVCLSVRTKSYIIIGEKILLAWCNIILKWNLVVILILLTSSMFTAVVYLFAQLMIWVQYLWFYFLVLFQVLSCMRNMYAVIYYLLTCSCAIHISTMPWR